jgi:hypothetical protein
VQFDVGGVAVQVGYTTVEQIDAGLKAALERLEEVVGSPNQKMLSGLLEGLPLHGEELIARWRERVTVYPEALRVAAIEHHWRFFPLWFFAEPMAVRDSELWRLDMLLEAAFNLLGVLAALNRVYYARFELKRLGSSSRSSSSLRLTSRIGSSRCSGFRQPRPPTSSASLSSRRGNSSGGSFRSSSCPYSVRREPARSRGRSRSVLSTTMSASDSGPTSAR